MNRSFYNGVIGSKAYMNGMDIIANNIANINTSGYKGKDPQFSSLFSQMLSESPTTPDTNQIGLGSAVTTSFDLSQGSLISTDRVFDFAIAGDGWFAMQKGTQTYYSRNGAFNIDAFSYLTDDAGGYLMGVSSNAISASIENGQPYTATLVSDIPITKESKTGKIFLPDNIKLPAKPTERVTFKGNLNPDIKTQEAVLDIPEESYTVTLDNAAQRASIEGEVTPSSAIPNPQPGQTVSITIANSKTAMAIIFELIT